MKTETMKFEIDLEELNNENSFVAETDPKVASPVVEIKSRRKAREAALQALYSCETLSDWSAATIHAYFDRFHNLEIACLGAREGALRFCMELIEGVVLHGVEIDKIISETSQNWTLSRMSQIDRNILRLAVFEVCYFADVPFNVVVNEAVELAKTFSSDDAPKFINGLLSSIIKSPVLAERYPAVAARAS